MYSKYRLHPKFNPNRKIKDKKTAYIIKIKAAGPLDIEFGNYAENFHFAAHEMAVYLLDPNNKNIAELDTYIFPLIFLYRHCIELLLKGIAFQKIVDKTARKNFAKDTFHDLSKILDEILNITLSNRAEEEINWLSSYFDDISKMDKESDSFRYPFHIIKNRDIFSGSQYKIERVFKNQTHIDIIKCVNKFEAAYEILELWYKNSMDKAEYWKSMHPVFIETGGTYYEQSVVGYGYNRQDFYPYASAYAETAALLFYKMKSAKDAGNMSVQDKLFFPMCYLYRNAVELVMKQVLFEEVREDYQKRCVVLNKKKHSIVGLWNALYKWLFVIYKEDDDVLLQLDEIKNCCEELQGVDNDASKFRYPCSKRMDPYFNQSVSFDYMNIAEFMESIIDIIDCIGAELSVRNEYIDEMEADYRSAMLDYR